MANQGEASSSPAVGAGKEKAQAHVTQAAPKVDQAAKATPAAKNLIPLTKQNLEKMINDGKGLDYISEATGTTRYFVKKAMREYGMKTNKMLSVNPVTTKDQLIVYNLIRDGAQTIDDLVIAGISEEVAKVTVRKMLNEGSIYMALVATPLTQPEQVDSFE
jgi:hypothetical protein